MVQMNELFLAPSESSGTGKDAVATPRGSSVYRDGEQHTAPLMKTCPGDPSQTHLLSQALASLSHTPARRCGWQMTGV